MKENKTEEELVIENNKLKIAGRILLVLVAVLSIVLLFNMSQLHGLKHIDQGQYLTVEECDLKYNLNDLFEIDLDMDGVNETNGSGIK